MLVAVGFQAEAALLPPGMAVVCAAANPALLARRLAAMPRPERILSFGVAGGLDPALPSGALLLASALMAPEGPYTPDAAWTAQLAAATGARPMVLAGCDTLIASAAEKAALRARTGAAAVDMESAVVARYCASLGMPFAVLRAVGDTAHEALPPAAAHGLDEDGNPAPWRVLRALLRRPQDLPGLIRLARRTGTALAALKPAIGAALKHSATG